MSAASPEHTKAMKRVMKFCVDTAERGLFLKPNGKWNGDKEFNFSVRGMSDSDFAKDTEKRRSVSGWVTFLCDAPVTAKSKMQEITALSVTEAELIAAVQCAQDMLFIMRVLESMELKVKKPMVLEMDNQGAIDLINNWSAGGRTRHMDVRYHFLRDLKLDKVIVVRHVASQDNCADPMTKNLPGPLYEKHSQKLMRG